MSTYAKQRILEKLHSVFDTFDRTDRYVAYCTLHQINTRYGVFIYYDDNITLNAHVPDPALQAMLDDISKAGPTIKASLYGSIESDFLNEEIVPNTGSERVFCTLSDGRVVVPVVCEDDGMYAIDPSTYEKDSTVLNGPIDFAGSRVVPSENGTLPTLVFVLRTKEDQCHLSITITDSSILGHFKLEAMTKEVLSSLPTVKMGA